ncbi:MAG: hypothetical protein ACOC3V_04070 [bacterium]
MKRLTPQEWPTAYYPQLAKNFLLYGNDVMVCSNCHYFRNQDKVMWCDANELSLDDYKIERTVCGYWYKK